MPAVLTHMWEGVPRTVAELAEASGLSKSQAHHIVHKLHDRGIARLAGHVSQPEGVRGRRSVLWELQEVGELFNEEDAR